MNKKVIIKKKNVRSLTITLAIAFLALSIAVLLIAASLNGYFNLQNQREVIATQQQLIAQDTASKVRGFIQEKSDILGGAASISDISSISQEEQKLVLERLIGLEPAFRQLVLLNAQEQELTKVSRLSRFAIDKLKEQNKSSILSQASHGETYISSVYLDEITSEPMVILAVPITDIFSDFQGILMAELNLKFMWDLMDKIKIGNNGLAYVVDNKGSLIAFSDISRILKGENLAHLSAVNKFLSHKEAPVAIKAEISKGIQNTNVVATHSHLVNPEWAVVVELPVLEAYKNIIISLRLSLLTLFISFVLAVIFGIFLSKRITGPIKSLSEAAVKIGEGRLDTKIKIKKMDEIGQLASVFNQMTLDLKKSQAKLREYSIDLEKEVKKRTKALESKVDELKAFHKATVGRELKMIELKKRVKEMEEKLKKQIK